MARPTSASPAAAPSPAGPAPSWGVRVGLLLAAVGVLAVVVDVLPFFLGRNDRPLWLNLACLLLPLGLVVACWSVFRRGRREQRAALDAVRRLG